MRFSPDDNYDPSFVIRPLAIFDTLRPWFLWSLLASLRIGFLNLFGLLQAVAGNVELQEKREEREGEEWEKKEKKDSM